jgi:GTP cyclohydrolase I
MKEIDTKAIEELTQQLLIHLGEDPTRPGLQDTPQRVAKAYDQMLSGYSRSLKDEITTFENDYEYTDLIYSGGANFTSLCEHHLLPFFGTAHIAYVPNDKIIGLSKLSRAVDIYARRLQQQERITMQVAQELDELLAPKGVIVMLQGKHFCNMGRGVQQQDSVMKTIAARGCFETDPKLYDRFQQLVSEH